ncbi:MAG: hypothetical protein Aurels2KO_46890 [Aureliella sp.]
MNFNHLNRRSQLCIESLETRRLLAADPIEFNGIAYFPHPTETTVARYDFSSEQWLSTIELNDAPGATTAFDVDEQGFTIAVERAVFRYPLDGSTRTHVLNTANNVIGLHSDGNLLFVNHSDGRYTKVSSIDKSNNTIVDAMDDYLDVIGGSSIAPKHNKIFGRSVGSSPSDITYVSYASSGNLLENSDSPYHGDFAGAFRTWVFDSERYVVDNSGNVYATSNLQHSGRLGTFVTDVDFLDGVSPVVLNEDTVTVYSTNFLPTGSVDLDSPAQEMFVHGTDVFLFRLSPTSPQGYSVETFSAEQFAPSQPGDTVDPVGLAFVPDDIFVANDDTVLMHSAKHQSVFRWDPTTESYTQSIRLLGNAEYVTYSEQDNTFYSAYADGLIHKIDLGNSPIVELPFFQLPSVPLGLVVAGDYLVAEDGSGAWSTLNTIDRDGHVVDSKDLHRPSSGLTWLASTQEMLYLSGFSPSDLHGRRINADGSDSTLVKGGIGTDRNSPLHGSPLIQLPIRTSPDGSTIILGSGGIFSASDFAPSNLALANSVTDIAWPDDEVFTIRNIVGVSQVQRWSGLSYELTEIRQFDFEATRLLQVNDDALLVVFSDDDGIPTFQLLDHDLDDTTVGDSLTTPVVSWNPPVEILAIERLSDRELSATADVPGTISYSPQAGSLLPVGKQKLTATFVPEDSETYRTVVKEVTIDVLGVDFGDAPNLFSDGVATAYPVLLEDDGAQHVLRSDLRLGGEVDHELDGASTLQNDGGDNEDGTDEIGTQFLSSIHSLGESSASSLAVRASGNGFVSAWIDFNRDGDWNDEGEQVAQDFAVTASTVIIPFEVPIAATAGVTAARVRISSQTGLATGGRAVDGEVEDYLIEIRDASEPVEIQPVDGGALTIVQAGRDVLYKQGEHVLARFPNWRAYCYEGDDNDNEVLVPAGLTGRFQMHGDGSSGVDTVMLQDRQHLDLTVASPDRVTSLETFDLRGRGSSRLQLNSEAIASVGGGSKVGIHYDAVDEVILEGEWSIVERVDLEDGFHNVVSDGVSTVHLANQHRMHNPLLAVDVDHDGVVSPRDALITINWLNAHGAGPVSGESQFYMDASDDDYITPLDALMIINYLNRETGKAEGELPDASLSGSLS